ncbi:hypothetical protein [Longimicrobium sp.]|uniref:hypothetical protein n=1 Tax=Longimicrobium sp. TaxID=2029185 RepID=UPI002E30C72B|nr:hypothetical protein [Longimicrobium sp.]HEX6041079.1 hypothetical protein [Longimicrobium sp.]
MAIREGRWDCPSCGSVRIQGRHVDCPGCGKPRPAGVRFYLTDDAPVVTDAARLAEAMAGADWVCAHCAASNRDMVDTCGGCGAARGSSPSQPVIDYATASVPRSADAPAAGIHIPDATPADPQPAVSALVGNPADPDATPPKQDPPGETPPSSPPPSKPLTAKDTALGCAWGCWPMWAAVLALSFGAIRGGYEARKSRLDAARIEPGTIVDVRWERAITLEERAIVEGESFALPDSAQVLGQRREIERYDQELTGYTEHTTRVDRGSRTTTGTRTRTREVSEQVQVGTRSTVCGQRDRGNGYFEDVTCSEPVYETQTRTETYEEPYSSTEPDYDDVTERVPVYRSVPVYGTLYRWRGPQWKPLAPVVARGDTTPPVWPAVAPGPNRRESARTERYTVVVRSPRGTDEFEVTADEWVRTRPGQLVGVGRGYNYTRRLAPADSVTACVRWRSGRRWRRPPAHYQCDQRLSPARR